MCFIFITPCHLFEGDWIYQYAKHWTVRPLEVKTNKQVVTKLEHHTCSLLHIWILLSQPTTWMTNTIAHTWQTQLHALDKYNCVHLSDWHKTSNQLLQDFHPLKIHLWRQLACAHLNGSNYKAAGRLSSRMITTARPRMEKAASSLLSGVYRVREWW